MLLLITRGIVQKAIITYLHDGVTWMRLKAIAVKPHNQGGLGIMEENSRQYTSFFGKAPPTVMDERPETFACALEWLLPREHILRRLVIADFQTRDLKAQASVRAQSTLRSPKDRFFRRIAYVLVKKALFLFYLIEKKKYIASNTSFSELIDRAASIIASTDCDQHVRRHLSLAPDVVITPVEDNWINLALTRVDDEPPTAATVDDILPECILLHQKVSMRMLTHLRLTTKNMDRISWGCARMLSENPWEAKVGANLVHEYLIRLPPNQRTPFEQAWCGDDELMLQTALIATDPEPQCIWRKGGRTAKLFYFLANRFLGAPDSVLACEGIHAAWKMITLGQRALKFRTLVAVLKLRSYLQWFGSLPSIDLLRPFLNHLSETHRLQAEAALANPMIDPRARKEAFFNERFNLRGLDVDIVRAVAAAAPDEGVTHNATTAWASYVRFLFVPHKMYRFTKLAEMRFMLVVENKSFAGRDAPKADSAIGRPLCVVWFEPAEESLYDELGVEADDDLLLTPCSGHTTRIETIEATIAEISRAAGYHPPDINPNMTERDVELLHETRLLDLEVEVHAAQRVKTAGRHAWCFTIDQHEGVDIEHAAFEDRPLGSLTKMALARALQEKCTLTNDQRDRLWSGSSKAALTALFHAPQAAVVAAAAKAKAKAAPAVAAAPVPAAAAGAVAVRPRARARGGGRGAGGGKGKGGGGGGGGPVAIRPRAAGRGVPKGGKGRGRG